MKERIKRILCSIKENPNLTDNISDQADLINDVGLDSLQMINFLLQIEDEFDIEINFEELDYNDMRSFDKFIQFFEKQKMENIST